MRAKQITSSGIWNATQSGTIGQGTDRPRKSDDEWIDLVSAATGEPNTFGSIHHNRIHDKTAAIATSRTTHRSARALSTNRAGSVLRHRAARSTSAPKA